MQDSMVRNLRHFVEFDLATIVDWDKVKLVIPSDYEGNVVIALFRVAGNGEHEVRIESPEFSSSNPNGRVLLDQQAIGPIDESTWTKAAMRIKSHRARYEAHNGRQSDGATV